MANIKSAKKRVLVNQTKALRNKMIKSGVKTAVKKVDAAIAAGADAFITGEMSYHEYFGHEQEIQICVIGHYQSEQFTGEIFRSIIQENFPDAKCCISEINTNPILYL